MIQRIRSHVNGNSQKILFGAIGILLTVLGTLAWSDHKDLSAIPEKYVCKEEFQRRWEGHMTKEREERAEYMDVLRKMDGKIDKLYELHLESKDAKGR